MKTIRIAAIIAGIAIIILNLTDVDYDNLSWSVNSKPYLMIIAFIILIAGLIYSIKHEAKKGK